MPRLQYPAEDAKLRDIDTIKWGVLCDLVFQGTKDPQMILKAYDYAKIRGYDPYMGHVAIVEQTRKVNNKYETFEAVWPTLKSLVYTAHKTGEFAGMDPMIYGDERRFAFGDDRNPTHLDAPVWVTCTVFRIVGGIKCAFTETVFFDEFISLRSGSPTFIWKSKPRLMIAKCAKAASLRLAFAECDYSAEEMEGKVMEFDHDGADSQISQLRNTASDSNRRAEEPRGNDERAATIQDRRLEGRERQGSPNAPESFRDLSRDAVEWFAEHLEVTVANRAFGPAIDYARDQCDPEDFPLCERLLSAAETVAMSRDSEVLFGQFQRCANDAPTQGIRVFQWLRRTVKDRCDKGFIIADDVRAVEVIIDFYEAYFFPDQQRHVA